MPATSSDDQSSRIRNFLKEHAPYSILDAGVALSEQDAVSECSQQNDRIQGIVREADSDYSVSVQIVSSRRAAATCDCCSQDEMDEQWCHHAVALMWQAHLLGFFEENSGFAPEESSFRMNTTSPEKIAEVLGDLPQGRAASTELYYPTVQIIIDTSSDKLGAQIQFDDTIQEPNVFGSYRKRSSRALDNLLVDFLDESASWDESRSMWFLAKSSSIERFLGLVREYQEVLSSSNGETVSVADEVIDSRLLITWNKGNAELQIMWALPGDRRVMKESEVFGTGPYWTMSGNSIYRLSPQGARIASLFPYAPKFVVPRQQTAPLLEVLSEADEELWSSVEIFQEGEQPKTKVVTPDVELHLTRDDGGSAHFSSQSEIQIGAKLDFLYPQADPKKNLVFLRDRHFETDCAQNIVDLGFKTVGEDDAGHSFELRGDAALDFLSESDRLPSTWKVHGVKAARSGLRFSKLSLEISLNTPHGESAGEEDPWGTIDWFECGLSLRQNQTNVPISSVFQTIRSGDRWLRLEDGSFARIPSGNIAKLKGILAAIDPNFRLANTVKARISSSQALGLASLDESAIELSANKVLKELQNRLRKFEKIQPLHPSKNFDGALREYQEEGLSWLGFLQEYGFGGILADEMGLGKTVQTLALLQYLKDSRSKKRKLTKPALVVAPTSVITNWTYEARRFAPKLETLLLHGPKRRTLFSKIKQSDLVITSYALLRVDRADLERVDFSYVILDEAQNIKNPGAATTRAAKALKAQRRLALTGTPTENRPLELWSIFDFLMPGFLGGQEYFKQTFEKEIMESGPNAQEAEKLFNRTRPFVLRRCKSEVEKELPEKSEAELYVGMTPSQASLYNLILQEVRPQIEELVDARGVRASSVSILAALLRLRQVCNHPNSIKAFREAQGYDSGKFELFKELIKESLDSNRKLLVFSQFRDMLSLMEGHLQERKTPYLRLDGSTTNRQELIDEFNQNEDIRIFLISLKAGGTGLNLTSADTVIIYDPWWNPAVEDQAVDRTHRIGQTKSVQVYRLVTEDSIEQKILTLKQKKAAMFEALVTGSGAAPFELTKEELHELLAPISKES